MSLKEDAGRVAVLTALAAAIDDELKAAKQQLAVGLAESGVKQVGATLPDGMQVGKATWVTPEPAPVVADDTAFLAWVREHHRHQIKTELVVTVQPAFVKALLADMKAAGVARWVNQDTGEFQDVPGIKMQGRAPYQQMRQSPAEKQQIAQAWRNGQLAGLVLPELEGGE